MVIKYSAIGSVELHGRGKAIHGTKILFTNRTGHRYMLTIKTVVQDTAQC